MPDELDHGVREIAVATPKLRKDLRITFQEFRGKPSYLIEDFTNRKFYRIGLPEQQFLLMLDGQTSVTEALSHNARTQGEDALTEQDASTLIRWLMDSELLESAGADQARRRFDAKSKAKKKKPGAGLNKILFFKIPLGSPDPLIQAILPYMRPLLGWAFFIGWLIVLAYAGMALATNWTTFIAATKSVFVSSNWLWLGIVFLGLKFIHELWHGLVTRKFGGAVPEWGVQLLLFVTPLTYADASSSWSFPSKWQRIYVAAAGMYIELFIAAVCALIWANTDPGFVNTIAYNAVFSASLVTILFNANPLMRFDGYYILSDLTAIPNLGTKGQQFMGWCGKKIFLGAKETPIPADTKERPIIIPLYGILSLMWRALIYIGILITLSLFFKGAGMILAALIVISVIVTWVKKLFAVFNKSKGRVFFMRALVRTSLIVGGLFCLFYFVKVNPAAEAIAVVEFADKKIVRAGVSGFIEEVAVKDGAEVKEGELIARLVNLEEVIRRDKTAIDLRNSELRWRRYKVEEQENAAQSEEQNMKALQDQLNELNEFVAKLNITAPVDGFVRIQKPNTLEGRFLQQGEVLCAVTPSDQKEILLSIRQEDDHIIRSHIRTNSNPEEPKVAVMCILRGHPGEFEGVMEERPEARATRALPHPALSSQSGGPLIIRGASVPKGETNPGSIGEDQADELSHFSGLGAEAAAVELVKPRFAARATLPEEISSDLKEGEWGYARFEGLERERLGIWLFSKGYNYVTTQLELMQQTSMN